MASLLRRDDVHLIPRRLRHDFDRLVEAVFSGPIGSALGGEFIPSIELSESDTEYLVTAELPGLTEKDIRIEIDENGTLFIRGEKKSEATETRHGREFSERSYGQFTRSIQVPTNVDADKIVAKMRDGVLELHLPKTAQTKMRSIPIGKAEPKSIAGGKPPQG